VHPNPQPRTPTRPTAGGRVRAALAGLAVLAAAGCSGTTSAAATATAHRFAAGGGASLGAAALTGYADRAAPTALPPATGTTAGAERGLAGTLPQATAIPGHDAASVGGALAFAAHVAAVTRLDRGYLCGPRAASPITALATPYLRRYLADPKTRAARSDLEETFGNARNRDGCGELHWVGPGTVLGPQTWTVGPRGNGDVAVTWTGTVGYALADGRGRQEPWGTTGTTTFLLTQVGAGWALDGWDNTRAGLGLGWPHDAPIPAAYLPVPAPPAADATALAAVHRAAGLWRTAPASTITVEAGQTGATSTQQGRKVDHLTGTTTAAPARGDAVTVYSYDGGRTNQRSLDLDGGRRSLAQVAGKAHPAPGRTLPARLLWTSVDDTARREGTSAVTNPFAAVAVLAQASAAAPEPCPAGVAAARCYTVVLVTSDRGDPVARQLDGSGYRTGRPYLVLRVGLDDRGRPAYLSVAQTARVLGAPYATITQTSRFTAYPGTAPPPVAVPDPATVAPLENVEY